MYSTFSIANPSRGTISYDAPRPQGKRVWKFHSSPYQDAVAQQQHKRRRSSAPETLRSPSPPLSGAISKKHNHRASPSSSRSGSSSPSASPSRRRLTFCSAMMSELAPVASSLSSSAILPHPHPSAANHRSSLGLELDEMAGNVSATRSAEPRLEASTMIARRSVPRVEHHSPTAGIVSSSTDISTTPTTASEISPRSYLSPFAPPLPLFESHSCYQSAACATPAAGDDMLALYGGNSFENSENWLCPL